MNVFNSFYVKAVVFKVILGAAASCGNLSEMELLGPTPDNKPETLKMGPTNLYATGAHPDMWKFENYCVKGKDR